MVTYRTGGGTTIQRQIDAKTAGGNVEITMPTKNDLFVTVEEVNKAGSTVRTSRFLATEVLELSEGQLPPQKVGKGK